MKTTKKILILSLASAMLISTGAQAFCFMKGNNNNSRMHDYYNYRAPVAAYSPAQYYAYPAGSQSSGGWYGYDYPGVMPGQAGAATYGGAQGWR
ncbi:MAG: hypothetical protein OEY45_05545 [Gammaproteobacteria bacterium]|nr:hypothetical protein [Gammaproteobacteria bacterium]MDH5514607.1 hypothetical protein [Gammaproteobacteria bacterium]